MATATSSVGGGNLTVGGTGYSGSEVFVNVAFVSTNGRRRSNEMFRAPVAAGTVALVIPTPQTSGTLSARAVDPTGATVLATATDLPV